mmetsp:Transcript_17146/g.28659  ORF Transcript_17146/g.28659 Transcript_17146/m.28659 type:complete len:869 (+) Transcript_17146:111-2717(+)
MQASNSTIRTLKDEVLEEYEPMSSLYWKKNKKPNIDIRESPFALDRQLEDQRFSMQHNRNPRRSELSKGEKLRSEKFVKRADPSALKTKAKVINKIVREVSGVHTYALIPPIEKRDKKVKEEVDPDTHPLMKPYRDESTRNPVMCSFGHRPRSASRTFHPSTMKVRLRHEEVAAAGEPGQGSFGLQPAVLAKLLHAPKLTYDPDADSKSRGSAPPSGWEDPHNLFLSEDELFDKTADSTSLSEQSGHLGHGGGLEHSKSWNAASFSELGDEFNGTVSFAKNSSRRSKKSIKKKKDNKLDSSGWNNHFHVIERSANENFELRKSGIAELKLMPLKERLTRFATIAVRESRPDPFCAEKKHTDALLLSGKDAPPREVFDLKANPYYDAEVNEDVRIIQLNHEIDSEKKRKELALKRHKADLKSIPKCTYHPDLSVLNMHEITDEESAMKKSENEPSTSEKEFRSVGDLYNTFSPPKNEEPKKSKKMKKSSTRKGKSTEDKIRFFASNYLGADMEAADSIATNKSKNDKKKSSVKYNIDKVFDHVMQPFDEFLRDDDYEEEETEEQEEEQAANDAVDEDEELRKLSEQDVTPKQDGTDITNLLQEQEEIGAKEGFRENEYDYNAMGEDTVGDDLHYDEDEALQQQSLLDATREDMDDDVDGPIHTADELEKDDEFHEHDEGLEESRDISQQQVEHADMLEESEVDVSNSHSVMQADDMFQSSFVNQKHHNAITKPDEGSSNVDDEVRMNEQQSQSINHPDDDMFQSSFVNQDHHELEKEEVVQEDDPLDNPHIEEQPLYMDEGEDDEQEDDVNGGDYGHPVQQDHEEQDQGEGEGQGNVNEDEELENYDEGNLDFANDDLDDDGMFTEKQY